MLLFMEQYTSDNFADVLQIIREEIIILGYSKTSYRSAHIWQQYLTCISFTVRADLASSIPPNIDPTIQYKSNVFKTETTHWKGQAP